MKKTVVKYLLITIGLLTIPVIIFITNPFLFWHIGSTYKTQTILFENKKDPSKNIAFQMQDSGAFGYNRRIAKIEKGIIWDSYADFDTTGIDTTQWKKVNVFVNELGLKFP